MNVVAMVAVSGGALQRLDDEGNAVSEPVHPPDLAAAVAKLEVDRPRWLWASTEHAYPALLRAGVWVRRCHDLELVEGLLLAAEGDYGAPRNVAAAHARLTGGPVPPDQPVRQADPPGAGQGTLFGVRADSSSFPLLAKVYQAQRAKISGRMRLLAAAESASALIAVEMGHEGLPWRCDVHDELLVGLLGPPVGGTPRKLATLAATIAELLDWPGLHPDSPAELVRALRRAGVDVDNTRSWTLKQIDHPVIPLVVEYRELYRIWTAHGWSWRDQWVRDGRFRPAYVPAGVVSGRWATRGGGALQIPKAMRGAACADHGWKLVVADAGQLEPRILAAVSEDEGLGRAAAGGDLYSALAEESFGGDRARAKLALLGAMYGQTGGSAAPALAALRGNYPRAWAYVESAARTGENGGLVRSWLGRTCPPSSFDIGVPAKGRARGRFTRNFVIQATAAEWAATLLALVRETLWDGRARMVFFQHDEVIVHSPLSEVDAVVEALHAASTRTAELLFGQTPVRFPLNVSVVDSYADAK